MNRTLTIRILLILIATASISFAYQSREQNPDFQRGRAEASADLKNGVYKLRVYADQGRLIVGRDCDYPSRENIYESILRDKYKIDVQNVPIGDIGPWDHDVDNADGYNSVSRVAIKRKFGEEVFIQAERQAQTEFEKKYGENERKCQRSEEEFRQRIRSLPKRQPGNPLA